MKTESEGFIDPDIKKTNTKKKKKKLLRRRLGEHMLNT